jgi:hypothetical protein
MKYPDFKKKGGFKISGPCKAAARSKFDVYPSAYANAWGVRCTKAGGPGSMGKSKKKKGGFPDLTGDGKVTRADILKGRGVIKKRGGEKKDETIGKKERGRGRSRKGLDVNVQANTDVVKKAPQRGKSTKYEVQVTKTRTKTKTISRKRARRLAKRKNYRID